MGTTTYGMLEMVLEWGNNGVGFIYHAYNKTLNIKIIFLSKEVKYS